MKQTWTCWTEHGKKDVEHFRGTKTKANKFWKENFNKYKVNLHIGKLLMEKVKGKWVSL
jgi:hypothetical protein